MGSQRARVCNCGAHAPRAHVLAASTPRESRPRHATHIDLIVVRRRDAHVEAELAVGPRGVDEREDELQPVVVNLLKLEPQALQGGMVGRSAA